jgi:hypothetical protein
MRTKPNKIVQVNESVNMTGTLISRFGLANTMGVSFNGMRNLYDVLGYPTTLRFRDFLAQYVRHGIAKAIINRPIQRTWKGDVLIIESDDDEETPLEIAWVELENELKIKSKLIRLDKLTGLGQYGVLLLGFSDVKTNEELINPIVKSNTNKLLYVKPFSQNDATIETYVTDATNPRYGLPLLYAINIGNADGTAQSTIRVHYTRVIHVVDEPLESDIASCSRLEVVFNNLKDLEKIVGGSAEMFWKGARPGMQADVKDGFTMGVTEKAALEDQFDEFEHNLRRILQTKGIELNPLTSQVSDPKTHVDIQLMMISAVTNIPVRILVGSERGELSSGQDADEWNAYCTSRRKEFAEPYIVRPLVDRLIQVGVLPESGNKENRKKYTVQWEELFTQSEKDKVDVGKVRSEAIKNYVGAESVMPPEAFYEFCLGMTQDQITLVMEMIDQYKIEEQNDIDSEQKIKDNYLKQGLDENGNPIQEIEDKDNTDEEIEVNGGPGSGPRPGGGKGSKKKSSGGGGGSDGSSFSDPELAKTDAFINSPEILSQITVPPVMYHVTLAKNAKKIKEGGILSDKTKMDAVGESKGRVYLTNDKFGIANSPAYDGKNVKFVKVYPKENSLRLDPEYYTGMNKTEVIAAANGKNGLYMYTTTSITKANVLSISDYIQTLQLDANGNSLPENVNDEGEENELGVNGGPGSGPRPGGGKGSKKKSSGSFSGSGGGDASGKVENTTDSKRIGMGEFTTEKHEKVKKLEELIGTEFKLYEKTGSYYGYTNDTEIRISNHPSKFVEKRNADYKKALDLNYEVETTTNMYNKIKGVNPYAGMKEGTKLIHRRKEAVGELSFISHDKSKEAVTVKVIKGGTMTKTGETKVYYDDMFNFYDKD